MVTDIVFDDYLGKWNYRAIPKVKTRSYFLSIPKNLIYTFLFFSYGMLAIFLLAETALMFEHKGIFLLHITVYLTLIKNLLANIGRVHVY